MQDDVREIVLDYLRAREVPFSWHEGFVVVPDASAIPALASGRKSLYVTFDRESATLLPDVDYVTFGHPLLDRILDEVRSQHAYVERFFGTDLEKLRETGIPYLTWQPLEPGCAVPRVKKPRLRCEPLLVVRFQVDVEGDFRHVETFNVVVDLDAGRVAPERASVSRRPVQMVPAGFEPPVSPMATKDALLLALRTAREGCEKLVELKHVEAQERLAAELEKARLAGESRERLEHLDKELKRKYGVQARLRVVGTERWFVERRLEFPVRVEGWSDPESFTIHYDVETDRTVVELDGGQGTAQAPLHLRFCMAHHADALTSPLEPCTICNRRYCRDHLDKCVNSGVTLCGPCSTPCEECRRPLNPPAALTCELTKARLCNSDSGACELEACGRKIVRKSRLPVAKGKHYCDEHLFRCDAGELALVATAAVCDVTKAKICPEHTVTCSCDRKVSSEIVSKSAATGRPVCTTCQVICVECKRPFEKASTATCDRSSDGTCHGCLVACDYQGCGRRVKKSRSIDFEGRSVCAEHSVNCPVDQSHLTLKDQVRSCLVEGCTTRTCHRVEHACAGCSRSACPRHRHPAVDGPTRFCPTCLVSVPRCPGCSAPKAAKGPCPLCEKLKLDSFRNDRDPPAEVLARSGMTRGKPWRRGSEGEAEIWECRVGFKLRRYVVLPGAPEIYESERGFLGAFVSMFSGS
jgi:hypothetical protein